MTFRSALLAATVVAMPLAAHAQPVAGLYVGAGAGVNILMDEDLNRAGNASAKSHVGPVGEVSVGYGFGNGLRAEVEGNYSYNPFSGLSSPPAGVTNFGGHEEKYGGLVNVLYDFYGVSPYVVPYVGVGIGYEWAQEQGLHYTQGGTTYFGGSSAKGSLAYDAKLGAAVPIPAAPGLALTAEYRFLGMSDSRSYGTTGAAVKFGSDYNHAVLFGIRYAFGVAPAPVMATAPSVPGAVTPSRSYLVFFDWDKANLTERARQIISEAAASSTKVQYTKIEVNGYTDTSGTPKYNQGLSIRRAQAVAAELVKDGVPRGAISIQGFGETHLLVPTGPGVREPQNRRVEIIIR
jgi:outer membrane protein OmpA-like peptidoglycan-associated protein